MNYQQAYDNIILNAKQRATQQEMCEIHHIVPRSLGGSNKKENLVKLFLREHLICHLLLAKIYGGGMLHAALMMTSFGKYNSRSYKWVREKYIKERLLGDNNHVRRIPCKDQKRQKCSDASKDRRWLNDGNNSCMTKGIEMEKLLSEGWVLGRLRTDSLIIGAKRGGSLTGGYNKGVPCSDEQREKISNSLMGQISPLRGIKRSVDFCQKNSQSHKGKTHSVETKKKISESHKNRILINSLL